MTDGIIKGTGNSRYGKTVPNALTLYPTYEAFMEAVVAGTFPFDLNGINPAGWDVVGDKLGKATLLTDALCTALSLPITATPTQAMEKLRTLTAAAQSTANGKSKIETGSFAGSGGSKSLYLSIVPQLVIVMGGSSSTNTNVGFMVKPKNEIVYTDSSFVDRKTGVVWSSTVVVIPECWFTYANVATSYIAIG